MIEEHLDEIATEASVCLVVPTDRLVGCGNEGHPMIGDADTADFPTAVSRKLDKGFWMLEARIP